MDQAKPRPRRRHDAALKEQVLAECAQPGASVASVALKHALNANLVHKWRRLSRPRVAAVAEGATPPQFVALALPQPSEPPAGIRIELRRGPTTIGVDWPMAAAMQCALWMRELLR